MMSKNIARELEKIENRVQEKEAANVPTPAQDRKEAEYQAREREAFGYVQTLVNAIPREYGEMVAKEVVRVGWHDTHFEILPNCSHLTRAVCKVALCRTHQGTHFPPLQMSESVCKWLVEVAPHVEYIFNASTSGGYECEACACWVPAPKIDPEKRHLRIYGPPVFARCPLCDGPVSDEAWRKRLAAKAEPE